MQQQTHHNTENGVSSSATTQAQTPIQSGDYGLPPLPCDSNLTPVGDLSGQHPNNQNVNDPHANTQNLKIQNTNTQLNPLLSHNQPPMVDQNINQNLTNQAITQNFNDYHELGNPGHSGNPGNPGNPVNPLNFKQEFKEPAPINFKQEPLDPNSSYP